MILVFSQKQLEVLQFPYQDYNMLICDGAIRCGKTSIMTIAFINWAMTNFNNYNFAICGKTVGSAIKNIITPFLSMNFTQKTYKINFTRSNNKITIQRGNKTNTIYIYGGKDESSYQLIQGITLAGVLFDEVALMTESFVMQAMARCSVEKSRMWFNCNPASPQHWFYTDFILRAKELKALHLHFQMRDNPSLSEEKLQQYENLYSGVFYDRYVKGEWVNAEGLVYFNFRERNITDKIPDNGFYYISIDYGIVNPFSAHLWCISNNIAYCVDEYYFDSRKEKRQRTDEEHYTEVVKLAGSKYIQQIIIDPSASSFKETIYRYGRFQTRNAVNDVINGISNCMTLLDTDYVKFHSKCAMMIKEFSLYLWDSDSGKDAVIKENDHALDDFRYFVNSVLVREFRHIGWGKVKE